MLSNISFALVSTHARHTHFIKEDGTIIALYPIGTVPEIIVGVVRPTGCPSDEPRPSIIHLAQLATGYDPRVEIEFGEGTSPFPPLVPGSHPLTGRSILTYRP